jgi:stearoyl-CoA desaturase (delta-9 desaturase)
VQYHPLAEHVFRFWLWMTYGVPSRYKTASHILHHKLADKIGDPHSPIVDGRFNMLIRKPVMKLIEFFCPIKHNYNNKSLERYVSKIPDSGYVFKYAKLGPVLFFLIQILLFEFQGLFIFLLFLVMSVFFAYTVADGLGHLVGYRNYKLTDNSHNIVPWGILLSGEELHNNHHAHGRRAKLSERWYEFDIGYVYIRALELVGLAKIRPSSTV